MNELELRPTSKGQMWLSVVEFISECYFVLDLRILIFLNLILLFLKLIMDIYIYIYIHKIYVYLHWPLSESYIFLWFHFRLEKNNQQMLSCALD